ncbi:hypothetical protein OC845_003673 [Tilletia horrida]|nr:hypothetical protein OC845_003673 [Tilletia horrida]
MVARCPSTNTADVEQDQFFLNLNISSGLQPHEIGWLISGAAALLTVLIALYNVFSHAYTYTRPLEQRQIIRILLFAPVYAVVSFFSFRYFRTYEYFAIAETAMEAIAISAFLMLLLQYIGHQIEDQKAVFGSKDKTKLPIPFCCWRYRPSKAYFLVLLKWSVLQYVVVRPLLSVAGIVLQYYDLLCTQTYSYKYGEVYIAAVDFASISIALYGLIVLYALLKQDLNGRKPLSKFLTIKLGIFFTFYQSFIFGVLQDHGVLKPTTYWTSTNIANGLNALCTSLEMVIVAFWQLFAFSASEYSLENLAKPIEASSKKDKKKKSKDKTKKKKNKGKVGKDEDEDDLDGIGAMMEMAPQTPNEKTAMALHGAQPGHSPIPLALNSDPFAAGPQPTSGQNGQMHHTPILNLPSPSYQDQPAPLRNRGESHVISGTSVGKTNKRGHTNPLRSLIHALNLSDFLVELWHSLRFAIDRIRGKEYTREDMRFGRGKFDFGVLQEPEISEQQQRSQGQRPLSLADPAAAVGINGAEQGSDVRQSHPGPNAYFDQGTFSSFGDVPMRGGGGGGAGPSSLSRLMATGHTNPNVPPSGSMGAGNSNGFDGLGVGAGYRQLHSLDTDRADQAYVAYPRAAAAPAGSAYNQAPSLSSPHQLQTAQVPPPPSSAYSPVEGYTYLPPIQRHLHRHMHNYSGSNGATPFMGQEKVVVRLSESDTAATSTAVDNNDSLLGSPALGRAGAGFYERNAAGQKVEMFVPVVMGSAGGMLQQMQQQRQQPQGAEHYQASSFAVGNGRKGSIPRDSTEGQMNQFAVPNSTEAGYQHGYYGQEQYPPQQQQEAEEQTVGRVRQPTQQSSNDQVKYSWVEDPRFSGSVYDDDNSPGPSARGSALGISHMDGGVSGTGEGGGGTGYRATSPLAVGMALSTTPSAEEAQQTYLLATAPLQQQQQQHQQQQQQQNFFTPPQPEEHQYRHQNAGHQDGSYYAQSQLQSSQVAYQNGGQQQQRTIPQFTLRPPTGHQSLFEQQYEQYQYQQQQHEQQQQQQQQQPQHQYQQEQYQQHQYDHGPGPEPTAPGAAVANPQLYELSRAMQLTPSQGSLRSSQRLSSNSGGGLVAVEFDENGRPLSWEPQAF